MVARPCEFDSHLAHCMAGYSKRTLVEKLGIKEGAAIAILKATKDYDATIGKLPNDVKQSGSLDGKTFDLIQYFSRSQEDLKEQFPKLKKAITKTGMLWISWPKGAYCNFVGSDLNENIIRDIGLANGLVDVKVIAVDENWSGLKFVYRLKDR